MEHLHGISSPDAVQTSDPCGSAGKSAFMQLATTISSAEAPIRKMNATLRSVGTTLKNTIKWELSSRLIHGFTGAIQGAINYTKELNTSFVGIKYGVAIFIFLNELLIQ